MYEVDRKNAIRSSELQRSVGKVLKRVAVDGESLIVERDGYPIAVMVPYHVYEQIVRQLQEQRPFSPPARALAPDPGLPPTAIDGAPLPVDQEGADRPIFFTGKVKGHKKHKRKLGL